MACLEHYDLRSFPLDLLQVTGLMMLIFCIHTSMDGVLKDSCVHILGVSCRDESGWCSVDIFTVMINGIDCSEELCDFKPSSVLIPPLNDFRNIQRSFVTGQRYVLI